MSKVFKNAKGEVILGSQYPYVVEELISNAKESISVMLFYISYNPGNEKSTVNKLVNLLIDAKKRGVDVTVLLDKDKDGEVYGSRIINLPAYEILKKNQINVCFDTAEKVTHSKIVVFDKSIVVVGSHNWTGASFSKYDDTSIKISSTEVGEYYSNYIDSHIKASGSIKCPACGHLITI
jgi:phosphatidylserine/phosphatidylglycerophosphate/cardiolipin synthase-like enzyme